MARQGGRGISETTPTAPLTNAWLPLARHVASHQSRKMSAVVVPVPPPTGPSGQDPRKTPRASREVTRTPISVLPGLAAANLLKRHGSCSRRPLCVGAFSAFPIHNLVSPGEVGTTIIPDLPMRTQRYQEARWPVPGHTASMRQSGFKPREPDFKVPPPLTVTPAQTLYHLARGSRAPCFPRFCVLTGRMAFLLSTAPRLLSQGNIWASVPPI